MEGVVSVTISEQMFRSEKGGLYLLVTSAFTFFFQSWRLLMDTWQFESKISWPYMVGGDVSFPTMYIIRTANVGIQKELGRVLGRYVSHGNFSWQRNNERPTFGWAAIQKFSTRLWCIQLKTDKAHIYVATIFSPHSSAFSDYDNSSVIISWHNVSNSFF